ncbi:hypothetical protein [Ponticoccus alexandrii]|uniref:Colicin transporter n=1 Tax=Ponticoccus alexandrii TaxID=1943633 RepID=A0ABX7F7B9_9RHOB|nr:hypothetical protein [Ponticoccus alexandrii]ETA49931.1 hypothetical protein P279_22170 [Rhodobacteraceae bacterium PD-2]QRF66405.1 hypothetical protein GQA70_08825 [Ponticoccus alexandrii]
MSQIEDLQRRLSRALDRIGQTVENAGAATAPAQEIEALKARLAEAETALTEAQEAADGARRKADEDLAAAVEAARAEAAADLDKAVEAALAEAAPDPEEDLSEPEPAADPADPAELTALREALEDEQMANAQLQERLRALKARPAGGPTPEAVARLDSELQRLRKANEGLLDSSAALREANAQGLADAGLIDRAMAAELEALRAARASEVAEVEAVIGTLEPMLADAVRTQGEAG